MPQQVKKVTDMVIDEISLVDRPANQHAHIVLAKRDTQEDEVADYFDAEGNKVDVDALKLGDIVFDAENNMYEFTEEDQPDKEKEKELEVAKSAFGQAPSNPSLDALREQLSKALTEGDRDEVLSKALGEIAKFEQRTSQAEQIAKAERDLRLNREYIAKAAEYNVPVDPQELGPVLKSMWEAEAEHKVLPEGSCAVIHKALATAGQILFQELGYEGPIDAANGEEQVEAYINERVGKSDVSKSRDQLALDFYRDNPRAYDDYVAGVGR